MKMLTKKLSVGAISVALFGCGGGNESDPKLTSNETPATSNSGSVLSGVVLDGYLYKANVCLDKNNNAVCDSGDGTTVQTDKSGQYTLPFEGNVENYKLLVEAIANVTVDMDNPNQAVTQGFTLETPSSQPSIISPMTSMVASLATSSGATFDEAAESLASELSVSADVLKSDYAADTSQESREIHMLARGITRVLQSAQESSVNDGVSQEVARKGSIQRLANLDAVQLKLRTDQLSHGASNTEEALAQIGSDYYEHLKIKPEDLDGDKILTRPRAPRGGVVNDAADTFDWQFVPGFTEVNAYEFSLDRGQSWQAVTSKPINVGAPARSVGDVQVRIMAKPARSLASGMALLSTKAFTATLVPAAPTSLTLNDADNHFDWQHSAEFQLVAHYEYTLDGGKNWHDVVSKPQNIADIAIPVGDLKLRVKADQNSGRPAGLVVKSETAMTVTPDAPVAPVLVSENDDSDILAWENVSGFGNAADYEINLGSGWQDASANPYQIGNVNIPANTIQLRVKANPIDGRPAGKSLVVSSAFNKVLNKPVAPTLPVINDADNILNWTNVDGYPNAEQYEYSLDSGISYRPVTSKPQAIPDEAFKVGQVCVRIKASDDDAVGENLCSDKVFTVTPSTPSAPTNGLVNDALNTFTWDWVDGFNSDSDYEYRVDGAAWTTVQSKPLQLEDKVYAVGSLEVRVKYDPVTGRLASPALSNTKALTKQPEAPAAPTGVVVDDIADTLDWTFVTGFTSLSDYEWSMNQGTDWAPVLEKPVVVGDVAKSIDQVQVRVRANGENGMPAGAQASNNTAFTELPKLPAPTNGVVLEYKGQHSNSIDWAYISTSVGGNKVDFDKPEYYEFTTDQGLIWQTVTSKPQFVGPQAYVKENVGLRLKPNAISGLKTVASEILWSTEMSGDFAALQFVPMINYSQATSFASNSGWKTSQQNCIAEYDSEGKGSPMFWASKFYVSNAVDVLSKVEEQNDCEIVAWKLPDLGEALTLSSRSEDTLPEYARNELISDGLGKIWSNKQGAVVTVSNGIEVDASGYWNYVISKWKPQPNDQLLATIEAEVTVIEGLISNQVDEINKTNLFFIDWLKSSEQEIKSHAVLGDEALAEQVRLTNVLSVYQADQAKIEESLALLTQHVYFSNSKADSTNRKIVERFAAYHTKHKVLSANNKVLLATINIAKSAVSLNTLKANSSLLTTSKDNLDSVTLGSEIHQATLDFYEKLSAFEVAIQANNSALNVLEQSVLGLTGEYDSVNKILSALKAEISSIESKHDVDSLYQDAKGGLNRAHDSGYRVDVADAMIDGRFAKIDILGRYLPAEANSLKVWRCVEDVSSGHKKRVWMLLTDGLPNGSDDTYYFPDGTGVASVMGVNGTLARANSENVCGHSDWSVPHITQLKSLATHKRDGIKGDGYTINTEVFPNHKAMLPEYDRTNYYGGLQFSYWTNWAYSSAYQYGFSYSNHHYSSASKMLSANAENGERSVTLVRLVRENAVSWQFLSAEGLSISERNNARCAKNVATGEVWQLFQDTDASNRYKLLASAEEELRTLNSQSFCGESNWRLPNAYELLSLNPIDQTVFANVFPNDTSGYKKEEYVTNGMQGNVLESVDLLQSKIINTQIYGSGGHHYLYRFISK